jgi:biopolymer transport protein ExbD
MKMNKHDPKTDVELDMTPMIDIVFQLIIFFMLITDMTQEELELLHLPEAQTASPDEPDPKEIRPVINILSEGQILVKRELLYDPENDDEYAALKEFLAGMAARMPKEPLNEAQPNGPKVPANALLIRADQSTPFKHIQKVMEICGIQGIQIWKIQLAAAEGKKDEPGAAPGN